MATRRIVFGDDESQHADGAWSWLCRNHWPQWTVDVLRVAPSGVAPVADEDQVWRDDAPTRPRVAAPASGFDVRHRQSVGDPRVVLGAVTDADLLVVGTRGRGLLKAMHLGSTSEWLLQAPPVPLLLIASDRPCRRILVCADGSEHSMAAITAMARWPWLPATEIEVLTIDDGRVDVPAAVRAAVEVLEPSGAAVTARLAPLGDELFVNVRTPILERMQDLEPDLVVAGTRGLTGLERLRVGSVATAIVRHSPAATLLASG